MLGMNSSLMVCLSPPWNLFCPLIWMFIIFNNLQLKKTMELLLHSGYLLFWCVLPLCFLHPSANYEFSCFSKSFFLYLLLLFSSLIVHWYDMLHMYYPGVLYGYPNMVCYIFNFVRWYDRSH